MNIAELCSAIQDGRGWLDLFRLRTFEKAYAEYCEQYGPLYAAAIRETGGDEAALNSLAQALLDGWEAGWKKKAIWNRSVERVDCKQMLVDYLSPLLLGMEEETPGAQKLCLLIRDGWSARRPKDSYHIASYLELQKGFRNAIMGIEIGSRPKEPEGDRY